MRSEGSDTRTESRPKDSVGATSHMLMGPFHLCIRLSQGPQLAQRFLSRPQKAP